MMTIWELRSAAVNDYAMLIPLDRDDLEEDTFDASGMAKHWKDRPRIAFHVEKRKQQQMPRADVSLLIPGALVLNEKARHALAGFLSTFGQLLELDCEGETRYFYNVTRVTSCIDTDRSELFEDGGIMREAFDGLRIPHEPAVFKDPLTAPVRIYVNDAGKAIIEGIVKDAGLTGIECGVLTRL